MQKKRGLTILSMAVLVSIAGATPARAAGGSVCDSSYEGTFAHWFAVNFGYCNGWGG